MVFTFCLFYSHVDDNDDGDILINLKGYENGENASLGPHYRRGGYKSWNWCVKCECVWDKSISWCKKCNSRLRFGSRYISRRDKEEEK